MAKLTFEEIVKILKEKFEISEVAHGDFGDTDNFVEEIGISKEVDSYGGEEQGSEWYSVRYFPEHDVYIKIEGWYSSYEGTYFDDSEYLEVFPTEIIVKKYLTKKEIKKAQVYNSNNK